MSDNHRMQLRGNRRVALRLSRDELTVVLSGDRNQTAFSKTAFSNDVIGTDLPAAWFYVEVLENPNDETGTLYKVPMWRDV